MAAHLDSILQRAIPNLQAKKSDDMLMRFVALVGSKACDEEPSDPGRKDDGSSTSGEGSEQEADKKPKSYRPHIPGRILYIYRSAAFALDPTCNLLCSSK